MKIAPIIRAIENQGSLEYRLVHTGQHYDHNMSSSFFSQLEIPEPGINLEVGSGTQAEQTAAIMVRYEKLLFEKPTDLCLVVGDVTSTMACAITSQKMCIPVAHVEGGIRSNDWSMPEEINRMVTDSITNWFFTTSDFANKNLRNLGVEEERIFFVGNTMIDTLLANINRSRPPAYWNGLGLRDAGYFVVTLHRPANVDSVENFLSMLKAIGNGARDFPVIFPIHPRSAKKISQLAEIPSNIKIVEPQPYLEFIYLLKHAKAVITDSGGITEEATVLGIPCMTLRDNTERPETIVTGTNELIGTDPANLGPAFERLFAGSWKVGEVPEKWDGRAGERIVTALQRILCSS